MADLKLSSPHSSAPDYSLFQEKGLVVPDSSFPPSKASHGGERELGFIFSRGRGDDEGKGLGKALENES